MIPSDTIVTPVPATSPSEQRSGLMLAAAILAVFAIAVLGTIVVLKLGNDSTARAAAPIATAAHRVSVAPAEVKQVTTAQPVVADEPQHAEAQALRQAQVQREDQAEQQQQAISQFNGQLEGLLGQSAPAYQEINQVFGAMQAAADGEDPRMTVDQADASLADVIANRHSLIAASQSLTTPTPEAAQVRDALTAAMTASLTNDTDIQNCLNQDRSGPVAVIFRSCLSSTSGSDEAATQAKQNFHSLYDQLRSQIGLGPDDASF